MIERLDSIKDDIEELIEDGKEDEGKRFTSAANSVFIMPFADVKKMLRAGLISLFRVSDQVVTEHDLFGPIAFDVIGVNHDVNPNNPDAPTLTLQMHDVLPGVYVYDTESKEYPYGHARYTPSTIRNALNTEILNGFSEEDRDAMIEVEKVTYTANEDGGNPETTADKLFLLSASEVGFTGETVRPEGEVYAYYDGLPANRRKTELNDRKQARTWWLRSPLPSNAGIARGVCASGAQTNTYACLGIGAAAACVIG
jgi:hypothetical protein